MEFKEKAISNILKRVKDAQIYDYLQEYLFSLRELKKLYYIQSFDSDKFEEFANNNVLTFIKDAQPNSSRFQNFEHSGDSPQLVTIYFTYIAQNNAQIKTSITIRCKNDPPLVENFDLEKTKNNVDSFLLENLKIQTVNLAELGRFISINSMNRRLNRIKEKRIEDFDFLHRVDRTAKKQNYFSDPDDQSNFCERCQESPCECSDPDPE